MADINLEVNVNIHPFVNYGPDFYCTSCGKLVKMSVCCIYLCENYFACNELKGQFMLQNAGFI